MFVVSPTLRSIELLWFIAAFLLKKCNYMGRSRKISYLYCATKGHVHVVGMLPKNKPFKLRDENIDDVKDYYTLNRTKHQNVCYSKCFIKTLEHTKLVTFGWIKEALRGLWLAKWLIRGSFLQSVISRIRSITVRKENNNHCVETCACHKNYGDLVDGWVKRLLHTTQRSSLPKPSPDLFALYLVNLLLNDGGRERERKRKNQRQLLDNPLPTETYSLLYGQLAFQSSARRKLHKTTTPIEPQQWKGNTKATRSSNGAVKRLSPSLVLSWRSLSSEFITELLLSEEHAWMTCHKPNRSLVSPLISIPLRYQHHGWSPPQLNRPGSVVGYWRYRSSGIR